MDVYVVSCDDYFQVSKGQSLKLSYILARKNSALNFIFFAEDCLICNCLKFLDNCNNYDFQIQKTYYPVSANYRFLLCSLIKIPSRQQHMLDLLTR